MHPHFITLRILLYMTCKKTHHVPNDAFSLRKQWNTVDAFFTLFGAYNVHKMQQNTHEKMQ